MDAKPPTYEELADLTRRQARQIDELRAEVQRLKVELEQSRSAGQRQAAPSSKGMPKSDPKRPGRKAGHPPSHRPVPPPDQVDRTTEVPLQSECPGCHATLGEAEVASRDQYRIDLPMPEPVVTRFRVPVARCPACSRRVQGRHPEQTSDALGSAAVQYGPRLLGLAADLKHRPGISYRKCSSVLLTLTSVVASAALARGGHHLRRLARPSYDRLIEAAKASAVRHVDETCWKIGGRSAWLWVFADRNATLYRIRKSPGHEVVVEVLADDYQGVLVSDCFLAYDPLDFKKIKCSAHLLKRCSEVERSKIRGAARFSRRVGELLQRAMALKRRRGAIGDHGYAVLRGKVHAELDRLLAGTYTDPDNARLAKLLRKHRESVLRFLDHDEVHATNNLAEREVHPGGIARKLPAGNRTEAGAETHAVLASIFLTYRRQGRDILGAVVELLRHASGHVLEFDHITPAAPGS